MEYRAVGSRCAVILDALQLPLSREHVLAILDKKGFGIAAIDIVCLARQCIGVSCYHRGARPSKAPAAVDCSSFTKWIYAQRGIWLPRRSIQQRELGETIGLDELNAGDLVFASGRVNYYHDDPADGVGHVGMAADEKTVIHAASKKSGIREIPLERFIGKGKFRGARRYIPKNTEVLTLEIPADREVETSDDIRWIILQSLPVTISP